MTNFIVFGKPRAFESYEFVFDGDTHSIENAHREPILKPKRYEEPVLHYFAREGFVGLEYYTRAKGVESERDGIVFGVAIKSASDFSITDTVLRVLQPYWIDFASALLDEGGRFVESSIINQLNNTQWSQLEIDMIQSTSLSNSVKKTQNNILLLETPKLEDISLVESVVKEYSDVYLSGNSDIFKDPINDIVLKEANNQIYQIQGGKIEPLVTAPSPEKPQITQPGIFIRIARLPIWGANAGSPEINKNRQTSRRDSIPQWAYLLFAFVFVGLVITLATCFGPKNADVNGNRTNGSRTTEASDTIKNKVVSKDDNIKSADLINAKTVILTRYDSPIKNKLKLNPKIEPTNCSSVPSDITFVIPETSLVHIDTKEYKLVVDNRPKTDTDITVEAYINGVLLGEQRYTIAKAEQHTYMSNQDKHIPYFQGRVRTKDNYLNDLRNSLDTSPEMVKKECQKIINGDYGDEYKNDAQAISLRNEAQKKIKANKDAESSF